MLGEGLYLWIFVLGHVVVGLLDVLGKWCLNKFRLGYFLSAGEWERLLTAEIFFGETQGQILPFNSLFERTVGSEGSLWQSVAWLCRHHLDAVSNKAIKKKIPLKLSLVFNILFIPMLLCFACGETVSKQRPRSEALGG